MAKVGATLEREVKLAAGPRFRLPPLPGTPIEQRSLTSTYWDTPGLALARSGVTLRRRVQDRKSLWQLKLPRGTSRLELELPGPTSPPPGELRDLVTPYARGAELAPVAVLRTKRAGIRTTAEAGAVAEVVVDAVSASVDGRSAGTFRELEAELIEGDERGLRAIETALRDAGATDGDGRPKLFRVLDLPVPEEPAPPKRGAPPHEHLVAMLTAQYRAVLAHDPGTRLGEDPEELHDMRVATRRLRAFLRVARPLLDPEWAQALREELRWLGGMLGPVRDLDVLLAHLRGDAESLEPRERRAFARALARLEGERNDARDAMLEALRGERYLQLLERLDEVTTAPKLAPDERPLADLAAAEFRRLRRAVRELAADADDEELHQVRIRGKRARYAAELAERSVGKPATRFIADAKQFQDVLGEHQDAAVAEERLRGLLRDGGGAATGLAIGRLVERQHERRRATRAALPAAWKRLERRGKAAWS